MIKTPDNPTRFIALKSPVAPEFVPENPLAIITLVDSEVVVGGDKIPYSIFNKSSKLGKHGLTPMRVEEHPGKCEEYER